MVRGLVVALDSPKEGAVGKDLVDLASNIERSFVQRLSQLHMHKQRLERRMPRSHIYQGSFHVGRNECYGTENKSRR